MAINRVILNGEVKVDLTQDTVTPADVKAGKRFHQADGEIAAGTLDFSSVTAMATDVLFGKMFYNNAGELEEGTLIPSGDIDIETDKPICFYNYAGQIMYAYTYEEFEELTEMPEGYDAPERYGLYFQDWNYTLAEVKATKGFCDVGAIYSTTPNLEDEPITKVFVSAESPNTEVGLYCAIYDGTINVEWGDGTSSAFTYNTSMWSDGRHTYNTPGEYTIKIHTGNSSSYYLGWGSGGMGLASGEAVKGVAFGNDMDQFGIGAESGDMIFGEEYAGIKFVTFPITSTYFDYTAMGYGYDSLVYTAIPRGVEWIYGQPYDILWLWTKVSRKGIVSVPYTISRKESSWLSGDQTCQLDVASDFKHAVFIPEDSDSFVKLSLSIEHTEFYNKKIDLTRLDYCPTLEMDSSELDKWQTLTKENIIFYVPKHKGNCEDSEQCWKNQTNWSLIAHLIEEV